MAEQRDPFRELLERFNEEDWTTIEEELLDSGGNGNGRGKGRGYSGNGGGGGAELPQGNPRALWWLLIPFLAISLFNWVLSFFTDLSWYNSINLSPIYWTRITASVGLFLVGAIAFLAFYMVNVLIARRLEPRGLDSTRLISAALEGRIESSIR